MFSAALLLFDAIPTGWVRTLQRGNNSVTASVLRRCNCAASVCPKMLGGKKLVWRIFFLHFLSCIFYHQSFAPIGLQKTKTASGWLVKKYFSVNYCDFFHANRCCNRKSTKMMVSLGARWRTLAGKRGHHNGSIDTNFDPPLFPLDSTFNSAKSKKVRSFLVEENCPSYQKCRRKLYKSPN